LSAASAFRGREDGFYAAKWHIRTHDRIRDRQHDRELAQDVVLGDLRVAGLFLGATRHVEVVVTV
jgi:hypothetical protein